MLNKGMAFVYCSLLAIDGWLAGDYFRQEGVRSFFGWFWAFVCLCWTLSIVLRTQKETP